MARIASAVIVILLGAGISANAQTRPAPRPARPPAQRIFISVNGVYQGSSNNFDDEVTFVENAENGQFSTQYDVKSGVAFNISGGFMLWRNVGVGVGVSRFSHSTPAELSASIPHPFFFNRPREVSGSVEDLEREELAVHVQARALMQLARRVQLTLFGGPSFFKVKQGIVDDFNFTEEYPYDVATFTGAVTSTASTSKVGFNVGADVGYYFTPQVGVGFILQYAGTTVDLPSLDGGTIEAKAGGVQVGGGLRLRF